MSTNTNINPIEPIQPDILERLVERARETGDTINTLLKRLLDDTAPTTQKEFSPEEWVKEFRAWVASHRNRNYGLVDDSRESIYREREDSQL